MSITKHDVHLLCLLQAILEDAPSVKKCVPLPCFADLLAYTCQQFGSSLPVVKQNALAMECLSPAAREEAIQALVDAANKEGVMK